MDQPVYEVLLTRLKHSRNRITRQASRQRKRAIATLAHGQQDIVDFISYAGMREEATYLQIDDSFIRTLYIAGFPYVATTGWLSMLTSFNHNCDISYHIEQIDAHLALPKLQRKITELESTKRALQKRGAIVGSEITDPLASAITLKDNILRGQEKLFQVAIYITIMANSLEELNRVTTLLHTTMASRLFYTKVATFQQLAGFQSVLPRGENQLGHKRNLDTSSTALTFPFVSSELVHENGILFGINKANNSLVIVDRFCLPNANSITFAQSGAGKSYAAKIEILRQLMQGTRVIVIDPEREYSQLASSVKGTTITLSANTPININAFDLSLTGTANETFAQHIQSLTDIIALMVDGLTPEEKAILDTAIIQTYKACGITKAKKKKEARYPVLQDLYATLHNHNQTDLCNRLAPYVTGSLAKIFSTQTNIDLTNRLIVFDIKAVPESLRQLMMIVIAHFVENQVKYQPVKRLLVIDEAWLLLEQQASARFLAGLVRRARKYFLGVSIISQQANDFLNNEYGRVIASQTALRILLKQDTTTIAGVTKAFQLSTAEQQLLLTANRGEALVLADQQHVALSIVASEKEHPLLTTDPHDRFVP